MLRRRFISLIGGAASLGALRLAPGEAVAETPAKVYRVGLVNPGPPPQDSTVEIAALIRGLAKRGYTSGGNLIFDRKGAQGQLSRLPHLIDQLVAGRTDVIVTFGFPPALVAKQRASGIPVVVTKSGDPVATGLVASLARPGGNVTGISEVATDLSVKRLELLKELVPPLRKVALLWNLDDLGMTLRYRAAEAEGKRLGIAIQPLGVREPNDFDAAFAAMDRDPPGAILMVTDVLTLLNRRRVFEYALAHRIPAIYEYDPLVREGGLMSYGPDLEEVYDNAAGLVDRILKGTKPAELPIEQSTRFRFAINTRTATALGITIPESIMLRADVVIE